MTQQYSKSRQQAEIAFAKAQSQFLARAQPVEEFDLIVQARDAKTLRLRKARLAKEFGGSRQDDRRPISKAATKAGPSASVAIQTEYGFEKQQGQ